MPELPEVETVRSGILSGLGENPKITEIKIFRPRLRIDIPKKLASHMNHQPILGIRRRAKYLLFDLPHGTMISHLGMSGSWRLIAPEVVFEKLKHDHFLIHFHQGQRLVFNDPRRFGLIDWAPSGEEAESRWLRHLGAEPLSHEFNVEYITSRAKGKDAPVKNFIMDQKILVGVGNIYVAEALFLAGVKPVRKAGRIKLREWQLIVGAIKSVLRKAIEHKGTTLRDYMQVSSEAGHFQNELFVYDRKELPCRVCRQPIQSRRLGGRSSFWCKKCQK